LNMGTHVEETITDGFDEVVLRELYAGVVKD
jgi:hypothetical protein